MAKEKIEDIRMEPVTNGVIISYCKRTPADSKDKFANSSYEYCKEVFDTDNGEKGEKEEEDGMEKAFARFKELWKQAYMDTKS